MLQITILGCGSSLGVPIIGCNCNVCYSSSNYNKRTRSAIYIDNDDSQVLIDFGLDIKTQLIRENITKLDGAILSHDHSDHVSGIDELRIFSIIQRTPLNIFTDYDTALIIKNRYKYLFTSNQLVMKSIDFYAQFKINTMSIQSFRQYHGTIDSLGIRINDFVYSSDVADFPDESKPFLQNIQVWILDCLGYESDKCHAGLDRILRWNDEYKPKKILLTNMPHTIDYHEIIKKLPTNIAPAYDGYRFVV